MNNPHAEGVPRTSAVAAMSQRSENEAFLERTPKIGSDLMKSEPLTCNLSWLGTERLRVSCSTFLSLCSDTAQGADGGIL